MGVSSGAIAAIAVRVAGELDEGNVVFVVCDDGWKYLSSGVYSRSVDELEADGTLESRVLLVIRSARPGSPRRPDGVVVVGRRARARRPRRQLVAELLVVLVRVLVERPRCCRRRRPENESRISRKPLPSERAASGQLLRAEHDQRDHGDHRDLHRGWTESHGSG